MIKKCQKHAAGVKQGDMMSRKSNLLLSQMSMWRIGKIVGGDQL